MRLFTLCALCVLLAGCGGGGGGNSTPIISPPPGSNPVPPGTYAGGFNALPPDGGTGELTLTIAADGTTVSGLASDDGISLPAPHGYAVAGTYQAVNGSLAISFGTAGPDDTGHPGPNFWTMTGAVGLVSGHVKGTVEIKFNGHHYQNVSIDLQ